MLQLLRKFHAIPSFLVIFFCNSRDQTQNLVRATQSSASEPHASFPLSYSSYLSFLVLYFLWCVDESHSSLGFIIYIPAWPQIHGDPLACLQRAEISGMSYHAS